MRFFAARSALCQVARRRALASRDGPSRGPRARCASGAMRSRIAVTALDALPHSFAFLRRSPLHGLRRDLRRARRGASPRQGRGPACPGRRMPASCSLIEGAAEPPQDRSPGSRPAVRPLRTRGPSSRPLPGPLRGRCGHARRPSGTSSPVFLIGRHRRSRDFASLRYRRAFAGRRAPGQRAQRSPRTGRTRSPCPRTAPSPCSAPRARSAGAR